MSETKIREFTIIFVDDNIKSIRPQISEIEVYLRTEKGLKLNPLEDAESGGKVDEYLKNDVEIVVTDNSMGNEGDGLKIIEKVRGKNDLIDILLYSAKGLKIDDYKQACHYTAVAVVDDKNFVDRLMDLIDRNLGKWDDVFFLRGMLISSTIDLEIEIDEFLAKFFGVHKRAEKFFDLILEGSVMTLNTKRIFLTKIIEENKWGDYETISEALKDIEFERNILAHAKYDHANNQFISRKSGEQIFNKSRMDKTLKKINMLSDKLDEFARKF